jgi:proteasome lid subunit RPN8/RPN11
MNWRFWRSPPARPPAVYIHEAVLEPTLCALQQFRDERSAHEGVVYWAGKTHADEWIVTTCIVPEAITTCGSFRTTAASNAHVVALLAAADLVLLAQVHSHPGSAVDHSAGDDRDALMPYESFLSVVVPHYGRTTLWPMKHCGIHRFEKGRFHRLTNREIELHFRLIPARVASLESPK